MRGNKGFTLMEILVALAIIGILAALIFPTFAAVKEKGRRSSCMNNLKQLGSAFEMYCQDYDSEYVAPFWLGLLYPQYITDTSIFICPSDYGIHNGKIPTPDSGDAWEANKGIASGTSYVYYPKVGVEWYSWPTMYEYDLGDLPITACHIHLVNSLRFDLTKNIVPRRDSIIILTRDTHIARADTWQNVRKGPKYWQ